MEWIIPRRTGSRSKFLDQWRENAIKVANGPPRVMGQVADTAVDVVLAKDNLRLAWDRLAKFGGHAAGPNGRTFRDFTRVGAWKEIDRLHVELAKEVYRHGDVRHIPIPKRPGASGTRPLSVPDIQDRVVGRAEVQVLEPLLAPRFDERSFCRLGGGPGVALAHARLIAEREDRWTWIAEDLRQAFDEVPLSRLFEIFHKHLPSDRLLDLIRRSVDDRRQRGLYQGAPLSPLLMNVYLHDRIDRRWRQLHADVPLLRYMDDLLVLCREGDDVDRLYRDLADLVEAAEMKLKHGYPDAIHAMSQETVSWLGYRLHRGLDGLELRLPFDGSGKIAKVWQRYLRERFVALHEKPDAPVAAVHLIQGIITWAGPTLPWMDTRATYEVLRKAARTAGFEEIPAYRTIRRNWTESYQAWRHRCADVAGSRTDFGSKDHQERDDSDVPW
jgi:retron-type reverse transcriptase